MRKSIAHQALLHGLTAKPALCEMGLFAGGWEMVRRVLTRRRFWCWLGRRGAVGVRRNGLFRKGWDRLFFQRAVHSEDAKNQASIFVLNYVMKRVFSWVDVAFLLEFYPYN